MTSLTLSFNEVKFNPVQHEQHIWLTASELSKALGYKQTDAVSKVYNRNSDEFTANMTQVIENPHTPNLGVRIFSLRGCHLIAMFARTTVAKEFRKWVLDILDKEVGQPIQVIPTITAEQRQAIKDAVLRKAQRDKRSYQSVYHEFYNVFDIPRYQELPLAKFDDALKWLGDGWYQYNQSNETRSQYFESHAMNTATHMLWVSAWWKCFGGAIQMLNPAMAGHITDHFGDGAFCAGLVLGRDEVQKINESILLRLPYDLDPRDRISFFRQR